MSDINAKSNTYPFVEVVLYSEIVRSIWRVNQLLYHSRAAANIVNMCIVCGVRLIGMTGPKCVESRKSVHKMSQNLNTEH